MYVSVNIKKLHRRKKGKKNHLDYLNIVQDTTFQWDAEHRNSIKRIKKRNKIKI